MELTGTEGIYHQQFFWFCMGALAVWALYRAPHVIKYIRSLRIVRDSESQTTPRNLKEINPRPRIKP